MFTDYLTRKKISTCNIFLVLSFFCSLFVGGATVQMVQKPYDAMLLKLFQQDHQFSYSIGFNGKNITEPSYLLMPVDDNSVKKNITVKKIEHYQINMNRNTAPSLNMLISAYYPYQLPYSADDILRIFQPKTIKGSITMIGLSRDYSWHFPMNPYFIKLIIDPLANSKI